MNLGEFLTPEAGQRRRAWLDDKMSSADEAMRYYLGPTGIPDKMKAVTDALNYTDAGDMVAAGDASRSMWNNPSVGNAAQLAAAGGALALPFYSARMGEGIADLADEAVRSYDPNVTRIFAGKNAKTADLDAMREAQDLLSIGEDPAKVWRDTGWMQGVDDQMRFEIDDSQARFDPVDFIDFQDGNTFMRLEETASSGRTVKDTAGRLAPHEQLYNSYPDLKDVKVGNAEQGFRGVYNEKTDEIGISPSSSMSEGKSTLLHEMQHAIQSREGFASGGNATGIAYRIKDEADQQIGRINERLGNIMQAKRAAEEAGDANLVRNADVEYRKAMQEKEELLDTAAADPMDIYRKIAGEVEARNVQTRRDFTPEQRRATPPWETQDVPDADQIVRMGDVLGMPSQGTLRDYLNQQPKDTR